MPSLASVSKIDFPFKADQQEVKQYAKDLFALSFPQVERMLSAFDNTEIKNIIMDELITFIDNHPNELWDWQEISRNPNLTIQFATKHPDKSFDLSWSRRI